MNNKYGWALLLIVIIIGTLFLTGRGYTVIANKRIGVVLLTREHQFFRELEAGLLNEAQKNRLKTQVSYGEYSHQRQVEIIERLISQKVDALIIAACDSHAIGEVIVKANQAAIPVFTVDIANLSGKGKVIAHIASDNFEGGRQAGQLMVKALKGEGKVVIINHPNITSCIDRVNGFREYLRKYTGIQIVADIPAWGQRSRAMSIMEDLLLMMPDLKGVFAINDDSALGAVRAIDAANMAGKIKVIGYDATPEGRKAIENGKIYGDVVQYPEAIGRLAIKTVKEYFEGKPVRSFIPVQVGIYSKQNR
ncbi:MAG: substrate-binding domain-containing protein [Bacteroidota bacterium]